MYKVLKDKGNNSTVVLENTDSKKTMMIGKLSMDILKILEDDGYKFNGEGIKLKDAWELTISDKAKERLAKTTLMMHKPDRKVTEQKKDNKRIDAMDVLLGLANYN